MMVPDIESWRVIAFVCLIDDMMTALCSGAASTLDVAI